MFSLTETVEYRDAYGKPQGGTSMRTEYRVCVSRLRVLWITIWRSERLL